MHKYISVYGGRLLTSKYKYITTVIAYNVRPSLHTKSDWTYTQCVRYSSGKCLIDMWMDMLNVLKIQYLPPFYYDKLLSKLILGTQGKHPMKDYIDQFDDFVTRGRVLQHESPRQLIS